MAAILPFVAVILLVGTGFSVCYLTKCLHRKTPCTKVGSFIISQGWILKEEKNVTCVRSKTPRFSTYQLLRPLPFQNPVSTPEYRRVRPV